MNKLEGSNNYKVWKVKIHFALKKEKLWDLVWTPYTRRGYNRQKELKVLKWWTPTPFNLRDHQDKAMAILVMRMKEELFPYIANVDDPKEVWNMLKNLYDSHNSTQ